MREEVEILKVNVQAAQAEAENAKANAAAAQIALADALAARTYSQANSEASQNTGQPAFSLSADVSFILDLHRSFPDKADDLMLSQGIERALVLIMLVLHNFEGTLSYILSDLEWV